MAEHEKLNIYSFNANGLGNFKKKKDVFDFVRKQSVNIFHCKKLIGRLNRKEKEKKREKNGMVVVRKIQHIFVTWKRDILCRGPCVLYKKTMEKLFTTVNQ